MRTDLPNIALNESLSACVNDIMVILFLQQYNFFSFTILFYISQMTDNLLELKTKIYAVFMR